MKIKIIAALISLVLTPITLWIIVKLYFLYKGWIVTLTPDASRWFSYSQILVGVILAALGWWQWRRSKNKIMEESHLKDIKK